MADVLLELLSEEIPARMQGKAAADLHRLFVAELDKAGLAAGAIEAFVTPRRLAILARDLPGTTRPVSEEIKGPRADAPAAAIAGFLGKTGLARDQLVERADAKGQAVLFAVIEKPGRATRDVLAEAIPAIVRGFPWPKSMRWGAASLSTESPRWVRPLQGVVVLIDDAVVPVEVAGIASGRETAGHRFLHTHRVSVPHAAAYAETLRAAHVIVDAGERQAIVRDGARAAAAAAGLALVEDEGLVAENAGLTEWPVPLLGRFDPAFLAVPPEVIQLTARVNQKYFVCRDAAGALANAFVCTANIAASDGGAKIVEGNRKVLAARLADARFFYEADLKVPLAEQAAKLDRIVFHEKLGTVADKAARVAKLARWLVKEGIVGGSGPAGTTGDGRAALADRAEQAALLCKADLVTGMVGEFPELQGVMGGYYAAAQGLDPQVAAAIRDHYKPVGQGDDVPTAPVTVAVSLADKLDTLSVFFWEQLVPTGSKDPFALRRAALSVARQITITGIRLRLSRALLRALARFAGGQVGTTAGAHLNAIVEAYSAAGQGLLSEEIEDVREKLLAADISGEQFYKRALIVSGSLLDFFADRLKVQQREAGVRHDLIDAVFALGGEDDLVRLIARVKALQAFVETDDGANLLAGHRRAANILRAEAKKDGAEPAPLAGFAYAPDPAEQALADTLDRQLPIAELAIEQEQFAEAMTALSVIRPAIDRFFDDVTINSPDDTQRATRLSLLDKFRAAMHKIADFSKIEG